MSLILNTFVYENKMLKTNKKKKVFHTPFILKSFVIKLVLDYKYPWKLMNGHEKRNKDLVRVSLTLGGNFDPSAIGIQNKANILVFYWSKSWVQSNPILRYPWSLPTPWYDRCHCDVRVFTFTDIIHVNSCRCSMGVGTNYRAPSEYDSYIL